MGSLVGYNQSYIDDFWRERKDRRLGVEPIHFLLSLAPQSVELVLGPGDVTAHLHPLLLLASVGLQPGLPGFDCIIEISLGVLPTEASIKNENVCDYKYTIEIPIETDAMLKGVKERTGLDKSKVIRRCIFKHLYTISRQSGLVDGWQEREVVRKWTSLKNDMIVPRSQFHEILHRRFVLTCAETRILLEQEQGKFQDFAEEYHENFYESKLYKEMKDEFGPRAFNNLENLVEEIVGLEFEEDVATESEETENPFLANSP